MQPRQINFPFTLLWGIVLVQFAESMIMSDKEDFMKNHYMVYLQKDMVSWFQSFMYKEGLINGE